MQALRALWRDWRAGELRLALLAVALAVAALTAVGFFSDRLQAGLQRDARQLLGGDAVLVSDSALPPAWVRQAQNQNLAVAQTLSFPTMARAADAQGGAARLVALKAVPEGYPLRGALRVTQNAGDLQGQATRQIPPAGQAWVEASLLEGLGLAVGDTLLLGEASLRIGQILAFEPDRGGGFINFSPRVMINQADLAATALVQPASRVRYRMAVAGDDGAVRRYVQWVNAEIERTQARGVRIDALEDGSPEMNQTLDRAEKFLNLVALLAALLSAVAVALAARGFAERHLDGAAMLRVLGVSQRQMAWTYTLEFVCVGLLASLIGMAVGYGVHHGFVLLLAGLVDSLLPAPGLWPALFGLGVGLTLLLAFGLPPVLQLARVPPLRVIRRDLAGIKAASLMTLVLGVAGFAALLLATSRDLTLGSIAVGGFAVAVALFALLAWGAVRLLHRGVNESSASRWLVLATRQIAARPAYAVVQVSSLAVGLMALVLLVLLRTDLVDSWRNATPPDSPNRFVINIMPEQGDEFLAALRRAGVARLDWYPMVRGRLVAINGRPVASGDYAQERARRLVEREFNLSYDAQMPAHNSLTAGQWRAGDAAAASVEEGLAETLGLQLGDVLRFEIAGIAHESRITSLRKVDWTSMHANFFVMFPVAQMPAEVPLTYLAAYRAPETPGFDSALVRQFPNITNVDMSATLLQVQRVLDQVIRAVEFLFAFTLAAGLVVLFAAVSATREERARELAVMRAMGAGSALLRRVQRAELIGVGLLAGLLASIVASVVGWALAHYAFDFDWAVSPWTPLAGSAAGGLLALAAGWWGLREILRRPVMQTLRQAAD
jgi:putative ABC transport system permease protein